MVCGVHRITPDFIAGHTHIMPIHVSENTKRLLSNFFYLGLLQGMNFLLPLVTIPYLIRVLGVEIYGLLAFATATITYFLILSDYGFNLTATRDVSIHRNAPEKLNEIFSSVLTIKLFLMLFGLLILTLLILFFEKFREDWEIYYLTYGMVIGQVLFPVWFFQGMEKMKYISFLNILAKGLSVVAIFLFIHQKSDFYLVPIFNSLGFIVSGIVSWYYLYSKFNIRFQKQNFVTIKRYMQDGWHIFVSRIAVVLYTSNNIFILGLFTNNTIVGLYSIAEQIVMGISSLGAIVNRVIFPYLSKIWHQGKESYYFLFDKIMKGMTGGMFVFALFLYILSPQIVTLVAGHPIPQASNVLKILAFSVVLFPLGGLYTQSFVTQQKNGYVTKVTLYTMVFNLALVFLLVYFYGMYGLAWTVLLTQLFHIFLNRYYFHKIKSV